VTARRLLFGKAFRPGQRAEHSPATIALWALCVATLWPGLPARAQDPFLDENSAAARERQFAALAEDVEALERNLSVVKRVVQLVSPTVVHIEAQKSGSYEQSYGATDGISEAGSGIIIELGEEKFVLTNRHVIRDAERADIQIHLHDGRILRPTRVQEDTETDVAVMAIPQVEQLIAARLGDSSEVEIGDFVLAVGSPFGLSQSVTYGIVSAKGRYDLDLGDTENSRVKYQNFLQTDAAINPGNSGGPLINLRGEVVGLNTAIASSSGGNEGIGFSIPVNTAVHIARQLVEHGRVSRAFLGVGLDRQYSAAVARFAADGGQHIQGARVNSITEGSPAAVVGIQQGDIILSFDGMRIKDDDHLVNIVCLTEVGREVDVALLREGEIRTLKVRVAEKSDR
jgi:serine protease Do